MYISDSLVCVLDLLHRYYPVSPYPRKLFADFFQHDCFVPRTLVTAFGHHLTDIQNFDSHSSLSRSPSVLLPIFSTLFSELSNAQASSVTSSDPLVQTTIKLLQSFSSFQAACLSHSDTIVQVNHVTTIAVEIPSVGKDMIFSERRLVQRIRHKTEDPSFQQSATFYETFFVFLRKQCSTERPLVDTLPSVQFSALLGLGEIATQLIRGLYNPSSYIQSAMIAMEFLSYCCSSVRFDKNGNVLAIAASLFSVNQILESLLKHRLYQHVHQHDIVDSQPTSATHEENLGENEDAGEGMLKDEDETNQSEKKPNTQNDPKGKPDVFRQAFTLSSVAVCLTSMIESCLLPLLHSFSDSSTKGNPTGMDDLVDTLTNTFIYLIDIDASLIMRHLEDIWKLFLSLLFPQGQHCDFSRGILRCLTMVLRAMISSAVKRNDLEQIISVLLNTRFLNTNLLETAVSLSTESSDSASPLYLILTSFEQSLNTLPVTQFESLVELSTNILDSTHDQILDALEANSSTFIPICHRFVFVTNGLIALLRSLTLNASILTTQLLTSIQSSLKGFSEQLRTKKTKKGKDKNLLTLLTLLLDKQDKEQKNRPVHHYYLSLVTTVLDLSSFLDVTLNRLKSVHSLTPLSTSTSTPTLSLSEACFTLYSQILLTNHKLLEHPGLLLSVTQSAYLALSAHSSSHVSLLCNLPKHDEESQTYIDIYPHLLHQITHTKSNQNNVQGLSLSILLRLLDHLVSISQETTLHLVHETITALISCRFSSDEGIAICPVHFSTIPPPQYIRSDECTVHYSVTSGHAQLSMRVDAPLSHTSFNISSSLADYQIAFPQLRLLSPIDCLPSLSEVATDYLSSSDALELPNYSESLLSALNALFSHKQHIHFILEFLLSLSSDIFVSLSTLITDQTKSFLTSLVSLLASSKTKTDILFPATRVYIRFLNTIRALPSARQTSSKNGDAKKVGELFGVIHDSTLRLKIIQTVIDKLPPSLFSQLIINLYCTVPFYTSSTHSLLKSLKEELKSVQDVKGLSHTNQLIVASSVLVAFSVAQRVRNQFHRSLGSPEEAKSFLKVIRRLVQKHKKHSHDEQDQQPLQLAHSYLVSSSTEWIIQLTSSRQLFPKGKQTDSERNETSSTISDVVQMIRDITKDNLLHCIDSAIQPSRNTSLLPQIGSTLNLLINLKTCSIASPDLCSNLQFSLPASFFGVLLSSSLEMMNTSDNFTRAQATYISRIIFTHLCTSTSMIRAPSNHQSPQSETDNEMAVLHSKAMNHLQTSHSLFVSLASSATAESLIVSSLQLFLQSLTTAQPHQGSQVQQTSFVLSALSLILRTGISTLLHSLFSQRLSTILSSTLYSVSNIVHSLSLQSQSLESYDLPSWMSIIHSSLSICQTCINTPQAFPYLGFTLFSMCLQILDSVLALLRILLTSTKIMSENPREITHSLTEIPASVTRIICSALTVRTQLSLAALPTISSLMASLCTLAVSVLSLNGQDSPPSHTNVDVVTTTVRSLVRILNILSSPSRLSSLASTPVFTSSKKASVTFELVGEENDQLLAVTEKSKQPSIRDDQARDKPRKVLKSYGHKAIFTPDDVSSNIGPFIQTVLWSCCSLLLILTDSDKQALPNWVCHHLRHGLITMIASLSSESLKSLLAWGVYTVRSDPLESDDHGVTKISKPSARTAPNVLGRSILNQLEELVAESSSKRFSGRT